MKELLRRVIFVLSLFAGVWLVIYSRTELVRVYLADPMSGFKRHAALTGNDSREEYFENQVRDRLVKVSGAGWERFFDGATELLSGRRADPEWKKRAGRGYSVRNLYFLPEEPEVSEIAAKLGANNRFTYIELERDGKAQYLGAVLEDLTYNLNDAPGYLARPYVRTGIFILLAGLAVYILIPWHGAGGKRAMYHRFRGAIGPDIVGTLLGGVFFALPLLVCTRDSIMSGFVVEKGYLPVTLIALACAGFGILIFAIAAAYAAYEVTVMPAGLRISGIRGMREIAFDDITKVSLVEYNPPKWLLVLAWIIAIARPRSGGPILLGASQSDLKLKIERRNGPPEKFTVIGLEGTDRILAALADAGVGLPDELAEAVAQDTKLEMRQPIPGPRSYVRTQVVAIVAVAALAAAGALSSASKERAFVVAPVPTPVVAPPVEKIAEQSRIMREMKDVKAEMDTAAAKAKDGPPDQRAAAVAEFKKAQERFNALHSEFEGLDAKYPAKAATD